MERVSDNWTQDIPTPKSVPSQADVVVIGGGIVGITTALYLAESGLSVVVCEKGRVAGEQSGRNWGWVRQQGRDLRELPLMMRSMALWEQLAAEVDVDIGFVRTGCLYTAASERELSDYEDWANEAREFGLDSNVIDKRELNTLVNGHNSAWQGALYTASDARAEPHKAVPAFARLASRHGATVLGGCAVRGVERSAGRVSAAITELGAIRCSNIVCAAGAWTSLFCASLDIRVPQLKIKGSVARTAPAPKVLDGSLYDNRFGMRRRQDGGYTIAPGLALNHAITPASFRYFSKFLPALKKDFRHLRLSFGRDFFDELKIPKQWATDVSSPFEKCRILNPSADQKQLQRLRQDLADVFPKLAAVELLESWAGMIESTPDMLPIIDEAVPGFHIVTGLSGHGFGAGPGVARAVADRILGAGEIAELTHFRLQRFFDGTPIRPQASI